jgi:hypothetical protein
MKTSRADGLGCLDDGIGLGCLSMEAVTTSAACRCYIRQRRIPGPGYPEVDDSGYHVVLAALAAA